MAEKPPTASPHLRRYRATGCHNAAIVLERLMWWWDQGTRIVLGVELRAKPRDQLAAECGFSIHQVDRALVILREKHLIATERHRFGKEQDTVMHYQLLPPAMSLFSGVKLVYETAPSAVCTSADCLIMADIETNPSYGSIKEPTEGFVAGSGSKNEFSGKEEALPSEAGKTMLPKTKTPQPPAAPELGLTAKKMLAANALTGSYPGKVPKKGKDTLEQAWIEAVSEAFPGELVLPLTKKQRGMLSTFRKRVAPLEAEPLLRKVAASWADFVLTASSEAGAFALPSRPDVGMVLRFAGVAANLKMKKTKTTLSYKSAFVLTDQTVAPLIAQADEAAPVKATKEEVLALLSKPKGN